MTAPETDARQTESRPAAKHLMAVREDDDLIVRLRAGETEARQGLEGARLIDADLSELDLTGANLRGADLSRANLQGTMLLGADLTDATLYKADLSTAELSGAKLDRANLDGANLTRVGLGRASLQEAILVNANLSGASLVEADVNGADLALADLSDIRAKGANWTNANVVDADLRRAQLDSGDVRGARFDGSDLRGACLRQVRNFKAASWLCIDLREIDFTGAYLCRSFIHDQNYLAEFRAQGRVAEMIYKFWWFTSDCGRSTLRWSVCTGALVVAFALGYTQVDLHYGSQPTPLSPLYFSVVTMTTLGYGDIHPISMPGQWLAMVQVVSGYVMLGRIAEHPE